MPYAIPSGQDGQDGWPAIIVCCVCPQTASALKSPDFPMPKGCATASTASWIWSVPDDHKSVDLMRPNFGSPEAVQGFLLQAYRPSSQPHNDNFDPLIDHYGAPGKKARKSFCYFCIL